MNQLTTQKQFSMVPQTIQEAEIVAKKFASSGMVPALYNNQPDRILVAWELGSSLGLGLMQSLQGIAVINGMPTVWGDTALAIVMASGQLEDIDESQEGKCTVKRLGKSPKTITFTMSDAIKAGLTEKTGPWKLYPKRMLQMRVRSFALRDVFPDILKGMGVADEPTLADYVNPHPDAIDTTANPKSASILNSADVVTESEVPTIIAETDDMVVVKTKEIITAHIDTAIREETYTPAVNIVSVTPNLAPKADIIVLTEAEHVMCADLMDVVNTIEPEYRGVLQKMIDTEFEGVLGTTIQKWHERYCNK